MQWLVLNLAAPLESGAHSDNLSVGTRYSGNVFSPYPTLDTLKYLERD
jgi:hypothetical protein